MESWMVSAIVAIAGIIVSWSVTKAKVTQNAEETEKLRTSILTIFDRLDKHGDDIVELKTRSELSMTSKDVDAKYVSKELFNQQVKHIDQRFDTLEKGLGEILEYVRGTK